MNRIDAGTLVEEVVDRYPATKVVLSRYGLDAYEEAEPSRQSVSRFAEDRGMPVERILEELNHVVDISLQEPPPTSFLSLLETHEWLDELFLLHQEALLAGEPPPRAGAAGEDRCRAARAHKGRGGGTLARVRACRRDSGRQTRVLPQRA